ncbi:MAG: hypothetical protein LBI61_01790, partial [Puniceicoccales bacterium]|nr:hypothetical protein [Puniceicoccales bacterium]
MRRMEYFQNFTHCIKSITFHLKNWSRLFPSAHRERTAKENMYVGAMFAAYQSFNDSGKKTDANMFAGCEHAA